MDPQNPPQAHVRHVQPGRWEYIGRAQSIPIPIPLCMCSDGKTSVAQCTIGPALVVSFREKDSTSHDMQPHCVCPPPPAHLRTNQPLVRRSF